VISPHPALVEIKFAAPDKPLNMNQNLHWARKAEMVRNWRQAAFYAAHAAGYQNLPRSIVSIGIPVRSIKVRRDPSNWYPTLKACVDGCVDAKWWPDDTGEWVATAEPWFIERGTYVVLRVEAAGRLETTP
jgi:hypothetical protein